MSADVLGNTSITHFDVLILGSGTGGSAVAAMLTANGKNVLVLEAGSNYFQYLDDPTRQPVPLFGNDELKFKVRDFIDPDETVEPRTFRKSISDGDRLSVGDVSGLPKTVGGSAVHADVKCPRFTTSDFHLGTELGDVPGASFADWPVDYDVLEPFYTYAEHAIGVQGTTGVNPFESPRSMDYPMPPGVGMYAALRAAEGARMLGYTPFPFPTAVNSRPYDGRPPCVDCGFCTDYACPINAKGSPAVTLLRKALLTGRCQVRPETRAIQLMYSSATMQITGVMTIGPMGERAMYTADAYVLSMSPIEDTRLLLLSDPSGPGLGNSSGQVGRNAMFHFQTVGLGIFDERVHGHRGRAVTHAIADFRGVPNDPNHPLGGIMELGAGLGALEEAMYYANTISQIGGALKRLMRQSPIRDRLVALTLQAEDAPQPTNRVDLDPAIRDLDGLPVARLTYDHHSFELGAREFYKPKMLDILVAAGCHFAAIAPPDDIPATDHVMGMLRFGTDSTKSVCRPDGRFWDIGNLYNADGALFPTSSGFNPILTIVTLASYVAASIINPTNPHCVLPGITCP